jgi:hypothetical protein
VGILLHDSMSIEEANKDENHLWFLYEHGETIKRDNISPNSKMKFFGHRDYWNDLVASRYVF